MLWAGLAVMGWFAPAGIAVTVPTFVGMQYRDAAGAASAAHLTLRIVARKPDFHAPKDRIVGQLPAPGEHVREGRTVDLVVSDGQPTAKVPNVANMSARDATVTLENARLDVGAIAYQVDTDVAEGTVLSQNPEALAEVPAGTKVDITLAKGRPIAYAPNFVGMTITAATSAAKDAHVTLAPSVQMPIAPSAPPKGIVVQQDPPAGQQLKPHQTIALQVSGGAPPTPQPNPSFEASASPLSPEAQSHSPNEASPTAAPTGARGLRLSVALPQSATPVRIRVVLLDTTGSHTLYDQQSKGGFTLSFDVTVNGAGTLQTYFDNSLVNSTPL